MQKFSYKGNVHCMKIAGNYLLFRKEILKGFGKGVKIIIVALMWGCESNRIYSEVTLLPGCCNLALNLNDLCLLHQTWTVSFKHCLLKDPIIFIVRILLKVRSHLYRENLLVMCAWKFLYLKWLGNEKKMFHSLHYIYFFCIKQAFSTVP